MRNLTAAALAKIATDFGTEPINIVGIQWVVGSGFTFYADRDIPGFGVRGSILQLSEIDNVVDVQGSGDSQQINIVLNDTNGDLREIFNNNDIHKRDVIVFQWFEGMTLDDAFVLFTGKINTPVVWNEGENTLSFDVINQLEDREVGFSAEEGQFPEIPDEMIGEPWPIVFGTVIDLKALSINKTITGTTQQGVGIVSGKDLHGQMFTSNGSNRASVGVALAQQQIQINHLNRVAAAWRDIDPEKVSQARNQANQIRAAMNQTSFSLQQSESNARLQRRREVEAMSQEDLVGPSTIGVLGGEDFPQNVPVTVDINGGLFTGTFDCQTFRITDREHPDNDRKAQNVFDRANNITGGVSGVSSTAIPNQPLGGSYELITDGPKGPIRSAGVVIAPPVQPVRQVDQVAQHFWADAGTQVRLVSDLEQNFIVSITPGTVLAVKAFKQFGSQRRLVNVPTNLWTQINRNFGSITAVTVQLTQQLSQIPDQEWEDDIYVTFQSDIGPNFVDIAKHILTNWSNLSIDAASFNSVKVSVQNFPMNFALLNKRNVIDVMRDLAYQARCAFFVKSGVAFLKFLPAEPSSVSTISEANIVPQTMQVGFTTTEDIITKMDITFRLTYAEDGERRMILRHNVAKYGIHESKEDWWAYTNPDVIRHVATFWLIRRSNTWKRIRFQTYLDMLQIETFDAVTLNFNTPFVANGSITGIVEKASYNSDERVIDFEIMTPVKSGTMIQYSHFWPSAVDAAFPAPGDFGGGGGIGVQASGVLPVGGVSVADRCNNGIFIGGPNVVFQGPADLGAPVLNDSKFTVQPLVFPGTDFSIEPSENPQPSLLLSYEAEIAVPQPGDIPGFGNFIDIDSTTVIDSGTEDAPKTTLKDVFKKVNEDGELIVDVDAKFGDDTNEEQFDFKFDDEGGKFGAGTAFLQPLS